MNYFTLFNLFSAFLISSSFFIVQNSFSSILYKSISSEYSNASNINFSNLEEYIIKPLSGELSNSISNLSEINEEFLRKKELKVKGWIIQPIIKDIWNGEYQMSFLNKNLIYSQKKNYIKDGNESILNQKKRVLEKYYPTKKEINISKKLIEYFKKLYNIDIDICRINFIKDENNNPILLEFEMVNPGLFIGYMNSDDEDIINITSKIREYCENKLKNNKVYYLNNK